MIDTFSCIPFDLPHLIFKEELAVSTQVLRGRRYHGPPFGSLR